MRKKYVSSQELPVVTFFLGNYPVRIIKASVIKTIIVQLSSSKESSGSEPTKASGFPFGKPLQSSKEIKKQELVHQAEFISI